MKVTLALCVVAAALAAQDTTPPVISLHLHQLVETTCSEQANRNEAWRRYNEANRNEANPIAALNCPAPCFKCERFSRNEGKSQSLTCEVDAPPEECPEPIAHVRDHHDHADTFTVTKVYELVNDNNHVPTHPMRQTLTCPNGDTPGSPDCESGLQRDLRSEWLIRYSTADLSGNSADEVSFTMIFQDTQAPYLHTEFGPSGPTLDRSHKFPDGEFDFIVKSFKAPFPHDQDSEHVRQGPYYSSMSRKWAESCWGWDGQQTNPHATSSPCEYGLHFEHDPLHPHRCADRDIRDREPGYQGYQGAPCATDRYDGDVVQRTIHMMVAPPKEMVSREAAVPLHDLHEHHFMRKIDTQHLGKWTVAYYAHDFADQFGYLEKDNEVSQIVTIEISDNTEPVLNLNPHHFHFDSGVSVGPHHFERGVWVEGFDGHRYCKGAGTVECTDTECEHLHHQMEGKPHDSKEYLMAACQLAEFCAKSDRSKCANERNDAELIVQCNREGSFYVEPKANCFDARDSWQPSLHDYLLEQVAPASMNNPDMDKEGTKLHKSLEKNYHIIKYTCNDDNEEKDRTLPDGRSRTVEIERVVRIIDTIPPTLQLKAGRNHHVENSAGEHALESTDSNHETRHGMDMDTFKPKAETYCTDTCRNTEELQDQITATLFAGSKCEGEPYCADPENCQNPGELSEFPEYVPGEYSIKYVCTDGTPPGEDDHEDSMPPRNTAELCVRITNVDYTKPILQLLGADEMTLEATHEGNYVDDGATCFDQVDGVISQNVEVSGDVVNLSKVGTYAIQYHCKDAKGNTAEPLERVVHIVQNSCPRCTMTGCEHKETTCSQDHEASFTYTDAGVSCSDTIDGELPDSMVETLVNGQLDGSVNVEKTGVYIVTYRAHNSAMMYNDYETCKGTGDQPDGGAHYMRTVNVVDTLKPVVEVRFKGVVVGRSAENVKQDPKERAAHDPQVKNPAYDSWTPGPFMAEAQSSASVWVLAAAAAAVAGIAMLGMSQRRVGAVTSVPV